MRETESLLIAAQKNAIRTNDIKARIDETQQNSKYRLCGDRVEIINHIISECSKLAREYKLRHDWVGKGIHWVLSKKFKFYHRNKWYMHNPYLIIINKNERICKIVGFAVMTVHRIKLKECEKKDKFLDLARELK